jgi:hypothetical protein
MPANDPIHDVIPQFYRAERRMACLRDNSSRSISVLIPHVANKRLRGQGLAPAYLALLSRNCAIRGLGVRETLR